MLSRKGSSAVCGILETESWGVRNLTSIYSSRNSNHRILNLKAVDFDYYYENWIVHLKNMCFFLVSFLNLSNVDPNNWNSRKNNEKNQTFVQSMMIYLYNDWCLTKNDTYWKKGSIFWVPLAQESLKSTISVENMFFIKSPIFLPDKYFAVCR